MYMHLSSRCLCIPRYVMTVQIISNASKLEEPMIKMRYSKTLTQSSYVDAHMTSDENVCHALWSPVLHARALRQNCILDHQSVSRNCSNAEIHRSLQEY